MLSRCHRSVRRESAPERRRGRGHITERIEPREQGLIPSLIDLRFHKFTLAEPEEHDCRQTCAEGADINGQHIHPTGNNALDTDGNNDANDADGKAGRHAGKVEFFL